MPLSYAELLGAAQQASQPLTKEAGPLDWIRRLRAARATRATAARTTSQAAKAEAAQAQRAAAYKTEQEAQRAAQEAQRAAHAAGPHATARPGEFPASGTQPPLPKTRRTPSGAQSGPNLATEAELRPKPRPKPAPAPQQPTAGTPQSQNQLPLPMGAGAMIGVPMAAGATIGSVTADPGESMQGAMRGAMVGGAMGGGAMLGGRRLFQQLGKRRAGIQAVQASPNLSQAQQAAKVQRLTENYQRTARVGTRSARRALPRMSAGAGLGLGAGLVGQHMLFGQDGEGAGAPQAANGYDPATLAYYQQMGYL